MGDRGVIATTSRDIGIYLHWNGDPESVQTFLKYCELKGYRSPGADNYGWAYLCGVITNYFGNGLSCGIDKYDVLDKDNGDNGTYFIREWDVIRCSYDGSQGFFDKGGMEKSELIENLIHLDSKQPSHMQLGEAKIKEMINNE